MLPYQEKSLINGYRKRQRIDQAEIFYETPYSSFASPPPVQTSISSMAGSTTTTSPAPHASTQYRLEDELDAARDMSAAQSKKLKISEKSGSQVRQTMIRRGGSHSSMPVTGTTTTKESPVVSLLPTSIENPQQNWGQLVLNMVGGVAGKMWEICQRTTFSGLTPVKSISWVTTPNGPQHAKETAPWWSWNDSLHTTAHEDESMPGQFPADEDAVEFSTPSKSGLCLQGMQTRNSDDWVIIDHATGLKSSHTNPASNRYNTPRSFLPRPMVYQSIRARRPCSSAGRRSSVSYVSSPCLGNRASASYASSRSLDSSPKTQKVSSSTNASELSARRQREEKQNYVSMRKLNQQLKLMIREGKEALAMKVEMADPPYQEAIDEDEGFAEGDFDME